MIKLKNIRKNDNIIECDVVPEDSKEMGYIQVDLISNDIAYTLPRGYEWCIKHITHAHNKLIELSKQEQIPHEKLLMWC